MNILLQGLPGIGKTTIIEKLAELLKNIAGFYTKEIRQNGERVGFLVKDFEGREGILAHIEYKSPYRVGRYCVNIKSFEGIAIPALENGLKERKILLIDEIGKMEIFSDKFKEQVAKSLDSPNQVIATIPQKMNYQIKKIIEGRNYHLIHVTKENRNSLPGIVLNLLKAENKN